jgi:hypothetical protein
MFFFLGIPLGKIAKSGYQSRYVHGIWRRDDPHLGRSGEASVFLKSE